MMISDTSYGWSTSDEEEVINYIVKHQFSSLFIIKFLLVTEKFLSYCHQDQALTGSWTSQTDNETMSDNVVSCKNVIVFYNAHILYNSYKIIHTD